MLCGAAQLQSGPPQELLARVFSSVQQRPGAPQRQQQHTCTSQDGSRPKTHSWLGRARPMARWPAERDE